MTDPAALTDEELAEIEADASGPCYECNVNMWSPRIFAALRASRAEHEEDQKNAADVMVRQATQLRAARDEVERMRGAAQFVPPAPPALTDNAGLVWQAGYRAACQRIREVPPTLT